MTSDEFLKNAQLQADLLTAIVAYKSVVYRPNVSKQEKLDALYLLYEFQNLLMDELENCIEQVKAS